MAYNPFFTSVSNLIDKSFDPPYISDIAKSIYISKTESMYHLSCSEIWGGIDSCNEEISTSGITASLYSASEQGTKGGDIYYLSVCNSDLLTRIVIADVVGHGDDVSVMSQIVYDTLLKQMNNYEGGALLHELNRNTAQHGIKAMTTAVVASYYRTNQNFYFAFAGHHPFLVNRKNETVWREININDPSDSAARTNTPLGIFSDAVYTQESIVLEPGDRVLLFTDGIIEAPNENGGIFGLKQLKQIVTQYTSEPIDRLKQIILKQLRQHVGRSRQHDDQTLLIVSVS